MERMQTELIFSPDANTPPSGTNYPRIIELQHNGTLNGTLLVTFEQYSFGTPVFPIYRSTDKGKSWSLLSNVVETKNNWGMKFQPVLLELTQSVGELPAGTILCSGNAIPHDMSETELQLYKSNDGGLSWSYLSTIVQGGAAICDPEGNFSPVWEPYLSLDKSGRLVCYYAEEGFKEQGYNQLLAHKVSQDGGVTWDKSVLDVGIPDGRTRPGMPVVAKLPNNSYIMVYEIVGLPDSPVYYKLSEDSLDWGNPEDLGTPIQDGEGYFPSATPYVAWTPYGGGDGMLLVAGKYLVSPDGHSSSCDYLVNYALGQGPWHRVPSPLIYKTKDFNGVSSIGGYSRPMLPLSDQQSLIHVANVDISETHTAVRSAVIPLSSLLTDSVIGK